MLHIRSSVVRKGCVPYLDCGGKRVGSIVGLRLRFHGSSLFFFFSRDPFPRRRHLAASLVYAHHDDEPTLVLSSPETLLLPQNQSDQVLL